MGMVGLGVLVGGFRGRGVHRCFFASGVGEGVSEERCRMRERESLLTTRCQRRDPG